MLKIKKIKPMFNQLLTTMDRYADDVTINNTDILDTTKSGAVKEYQKVLAVGPMVRNITVGDVVFINPNRYAVRKHKEGSLKDGVITDNPVTEYQFDTLVVDGKECLLLQDNDIKFTVAPKDIEEVKEPKVKLAKKPKLSV